MTPRTAIEPILGSPLLPGSVATRGSERRRRVLIVDDSRLQRRILRAHLGRLDVEVVEAESGEAGLERLRAERFDIVVSDWMMPGGMTGLEFCVAVRSDPVLGARDEDGGRYIYFILSTSKGEKEEIAQGLGAGADDFVTKPVDGIELAARIQAGERILAMQEELSETNRKRGEALAEVRALNASIERDLEQARLLQHALVRRWEEDFGAAAVTLLLRSSGHVGGDLVGFFKPCETCVGLYGIDVSGHGIASALMSARLAGYLSTSDRRQNVAIGGADGGGCGVLRPSAVAARLNELGLDEMETETYYTLLYADLDLPTGRVSFVQAGHPPPLILRAGGASEFVGRGGLPVGLIDAAEWEDQELRLAPGDRLLVYSDGVTECEAPSGAMLEEAGLARIASAHVGLRGRPFLEAIQADLERYAGRTDFGDDVSMALIEYRGA